MLEHLYGNIPWYLYKQGLCLLRTNSGLLSHHKESVWLLNLVSWWSAVYWCVGYFGRMVIISSLLKPNWSPYRPANVWRVSAKFTSTLWTRLGPLREGPISHSLVCVYVCVESCSVCTWEPSDDRGGRGLWARGGTRRGLGAIPTEDRRYMRPPVSRASSYCPLCLATHPLSEWACITAFPQQCIAAFPGRRGRWCGWRCSCCSCKRCRQEVRWPLPLATPRSCMMPEILDIEEPGIKNVIPNDSGRLVMGLIGGFMVYVVEVEVYSTDSCCILRCGTLCKKSISKWMVV